MPRRATPPLLFALAIQLTIAATVLPRYARAQTSTPQLAWTCTQHPDVLKDQTGACPVCGLALEPVRLDSEWTCPDHSAIAQDEPGTCPIDKKALVKVKVARYWTCPQSTLHEI